MDDMFRIDKSSFYGIMIIAFFVGMILTVGGVVIPLQNDLVNIQKDHTTLDSMYTSMAERDFTIKIRGKTIEVYDAISN